MPTTRRSVDKKAPTKIACQRQELGQVRLLCEPKAPTQLAAYNQLIYQIKMNGLTGKWVTLTRVCEMFSLTCLPRSQEHLEFGRFEENHDCKPYPVIPALNCRAQSTSKLAQTSRKLMYARLYDFFARPSKTIQEKIQFAQETTPGLLCECPERTFFVRFNEKEGDFEDPSPPPLEVIPRGNDSRKRMRLPMKESSSKKPVGEFFLFLFVLFCFVLFCFVLFFLVFFLFIVFCFIFYLKYPHLSSTEKNTCVYPLW